MAVSQEHRHQAAVIKACAAASWRYPEAALIFAIPNGGHRNKVAAKRLKDEGVRSGVPDLMLPVPRGGYHGLFIELKVGTNAPSTSQGAWAEVLMGQGYLVLTCYGAQAATDAIQRYLEGGYAR